MKKKTTMDKIFIFLSWKKTTIFTLLSLTITFALTKWYIDWTVAEFLSSVLVAIWYTANKMTKQTFKK